MKYILALSILASIIFFGCAKEDQPFNSRLYIDNMDDLDPQFQSRVLESVQKINQDAGGELIALSKSSENLKPLVFQNISSGTIFAHAQPLEYRCLVSIDQSNPVVNNSDPLVVDLRMVLLHEIGHCYNLGHEVDAHSIMFPSYEGTQIMSPGEISILLTNMAYFSKVLLGM